MKLAASILIWAIRFYRVALSPAKSFLFGPGPCCRYIPSCSEYAMQALAAHGALKGSWLALKRIARCHPWGSYGFDPAPANTPRDPSTR